jgi:hypothetical protein
MGMNFPGQGKLRLHYFSLSSTVKQRAKGREQNIQPPQCSSKHRAISMVTAPALNSLSSLFVKGYCHRVITKQQIRSWMRLPLGRQIKQTLETLVVPNRWPTKTLIVTRMVPLFQIL